MMFRKLLVCHLKHQKNSRNWMIIRARKDLLKFTRKNMFRKLA
ncbi:hypothetical protein LOK49_LG10G00067 [Camellia lanceoleosa]|uniref:Uncharacterized protein n=1 Tax=Camellia lanceoleosa TaxID=1840588 RepID=A0ACC0G9K0_9ERIC|nr:hypothetical protein LOK49_LG10G00067 [Camellia lanceoleosa]